MNKQKIDAIDESIVRLRANVARLRHQVRDEETTNARTVGTALILDRLDNIFELFVRMDSDVERLRKGG